MRKTLLVIGDFMMSKDRAEPSLSKFLTYKEHINKRGIGVWIITYDDVIKNRLPHVRTKRLDIMLFFPYNHWNMEIEKYGRDSRIYGDIAFGNDYKRYFAKIDKIIKRRYRDKNLYFINSPSSCIIDRDKKATHDLLEKAGIRTPPLYNIKSVLQIDNVINEEKALYIKPRFGAMGKGITYINKKGCYTNFLYKKGKIANRLYDYNWPAVKISEKRRASFLKILIKRGFIFQEAIEAPIVNGRKFDMRIYVMNGEIPYFYAKSAPNKSFITNWSQGGRIEKNKSFLKKALGKSGIKRAKAAARAAARAINLNYAGVDVIVDKNALDMYVLEIQSFPGYERGFNLMKFLADTI